MTAPVLFGALGDGWRWMTELWCFPPPWEERPGKASVLEKPLILVPAQTQPAVERGETKIKGPENTALLDTTQENGREKEGL